MLPIWKNEDAASENQTGQGSGHLLCGAIDDEQREDAFRQGIRAEFDARVLLDLETLGRSSRPVYGLQHPRGE